MIEDERNSAIQERIECDYGGSYSSSRRLLDSESFARTTLTHHRTPHITNECSFHLIGEVGSRLRFFFPRLREVHRMRGQRFGRTCFGRRAV